MEDVYKRQHHLFCGQFLRVESHRQKQMERIGVCLLAKDGWSLKEVLLVMVEVRQISITKYLEVEQRDVYKRQGILCI